MEDPLAHDGKNVVHKLNRSPKSVSSVYVYDKWGTELFELQCGTPEYYLRRVEAQLLRSHAADLIGMCGCVPIVELGAGTAEKTQILFAEFEKRGVWCDYFPIDVDIETLSRTAHRLTAHFPHLVVHCLGTTYQHGLRTLPACAPARLFLFLGSSLGNMELAEIDDLLSQLFRYANPGDYLVLGADLDKDPAVINRAYNDAAGYGPRSTLNILSHLNHRYDGNFVVDQFRYRSRYNVELKRNEVRIESLIDQSVTLDRLGVTVAFGANELIDAEIMWKFDPAALASILERAGFSMVQQWIEPTYRYGLFLMRRR
ncbi:MAG: L-histidine N(alpha)-methyltransferase [Pseudomonadota bacterium]|nr:L-histidine N(alpha)-methyltransferase [Pseudomonadota bacterium]